MRTVLISAVFLIFASLPAADQVCVPKEGCKPCAPGQACPAEAKAACPAKAVTSTVTAAELKTLIAEQKVTLLDANGSEKFATGRLPGAIDFKANAEKLAEVLPADKNALIVAYCGSPKCGAWKSAAKAATALGYTNVKHFPGGLAGWTEAGEQLVAAK